MERQPAKPVAASAITDHTYKVFPNDLNAYGTLFGGLVVSMCDRLASVVAERHSGKLCVTVSLDSVNFLVPAGEGETLIFKAAVNRTWRTSMEIGVRVVAEDYRVGTKRHILSAYCTFVALDDNNKPTPVLEVIPETSAEKRRYDEAQHRRHHRQEAAKQLREKRAREQPE